MTRPYSNDLRERVVSAVLSGESCRVVAARFDVAVSSVVKWSQRFRATGSVAPGKIGGHRRRVVTSGQAKVVVRAARVEQRGRGGVVVPEIIHPPMIHRCPVAQKRVMPHRSG